MTRSMIPVVAAMAAVLMSQAAEAQQRGGGGRDLTPPPVDLTLADTFVVPPADAQTQAVTAAAQGFLATLSAEQRAAVIYPFDDNAQRARWSNFPHPVVQRGGLMRGDLTETQLAALEAMLGAVLSPAGLRNVALQLRADDIAGSTGQEFPLFGGQYYFVSFLGEPATDAPWVMQFGGHHLAINAIVFGDRIGFSPMLTGGEPLHVEYEGKEIWITEPEVTAAQALLDSFDAAQRDVVLRSDTRADLLLGPGEDGVTLPPEGLPGALMTEPQRDLFLALIEQRLGFANADDTAAKMEEVAATLDDTYFGWWGPQDVVGGAYYRVTGPEVIIEYSPQDGGSSTDHAHNMYRDPSNDYGVAWIGK